MNLEVSNGQKPSQPKIDIPSIIDRIKIGGEQAFVELDDYLRPRLNRFFNRRLPGQAEDLTQNTLAEVYEAIPSFEPTLDGRDYSLSFLAWTYVIARNNMNTELRSIIGEPATPFSEVIIGRQDQVSMSDAIYDRGIADDKEQEPRREPQDLMPQFRERLTGLLSPAQLKAVELRINGVEIPDIIEKLKTTKRAVLNLMYKAREKIEGELFYPAGFRQLADYQDMALSQAAGRGSLEAVKFLGLWYTTDEWVQRYQYRRVALSQTVLDQGYIALSEHTTPDEYGTLLGTKYAHLLTRNQGRIYVREEGLVEFRKGRVRARKRIKAPADGYEYLTDLVSNITEEQKLRLAVTRGNLPAVKKGHWWFVKPEDASTFLATDAGRPRPVIRQMEDTGNSSQRYTEVFPASELEAFPENDFPESFKLWFFKHAKIISDRRLPWRKRRELPQPDDLEATVSIVKLQFRHWLTQRDIKMYPSYMKIVDLRIQGKKVHNIAVELGWKDKSVSSVLAIARRTIDQELIYPAGIKKVSGYKDEALAAAAVAGRLEAVWFLGRWYTTDEKVTEYQQKSKSKTTINTAPNSDPNTFNLLKLPF